MKDDALDSAILAYLKGESTKEQDYLVLEFIDSSPENLRHFADIKVIVGYIRQLDATGEGGEETSLNRDYRIIAEKI